MKKLIVRLESLKLPGKGIYATCSDPSMRKSLATENSDPLPERDGLRGYDDNSDYFGFKDIDQMYQWFRHGSFKNVALCLYEVPEKFIKYGGHQLCFQMEKAVCLLRTPVKGGDAR